ncbi:3-phosphoserine/phosphohydroxythreonine transaminase [Leptothrix discophora]|uniref:Phosphoserine aminotransferase n=1 Tax=Leptothrix discophora TaxID=89 RepID=A0ABT9G0H4_LEPDI|nr:3-phosphoserine/phosphohydroxythreonine transaminase [Leptothrix discophora]MDP4299967.1 3-phosphoserine/phosphohydroxythreonine transaminase [Leptothrix discophora]
MTRVHNFSSGPAVLPESVLRQAAEEMLDWHGSGMSVMEMSHRGPQFMTILDEAQSLFRELLGVPDDYRTLFLQGGAIGEMAIVPMNLLGSKTSIDFVNTGTWSSKAMSEASRYARINEVASSATTKFDHIPAFETWKLDPDAAYVHICSNETIGGVEYHWTPDSGDVPLVADVSSNILSAPLDVTKFGLLYGGAQKNVGPAGLTLVVVRNDLLGHALPITPCAFDFAQQSDNGSMLNTPPTYAIYIAGLVFRWLKEQGGLVAIEAQNRRKAAMLYDTIDASGGFYVNPVALPDRSRMNVPFRLPDARLDAPFLAEAEALGMVQLKGHRSVGGMRASIYNAMPVAGVQCLVDHMKDFARRHG